MNDSTSLLLPYIIDTHCHINLYPDPAVVLHEVTENDIQVNWVTNTPQMYLDCRELAKSHPQVHLSLGLIPQLILKEAHNIDQFCELLYETGYVGEIGLDYVTEDENERRLQREVFERILSTCAALGDKVISIHSRRAARDVIDMIGKNFPGMVILHWFSGTIAEVQAAADQVYFSINTAMVGSRRARQLIAAMNPDRILTETDGPFIKIGDRPARPRDLTNVMHYFATQWQCSPLDAALKIENNYLVAQAKLNQ